MQGAAPLAYLCPAVTPPDRQYENYKCAIFDALSFRALINRAARKEGNEERQKGRQQGRKTDGPTERRQKEAKVSK